MLYPCSPPPRFSSVVVVFFEGPFPHQKSERLLFGQASFCSVFVGGFHINSFVEGEMIM